MIFCFSLALTLVSFNAFGAGVTCSIEDSSSNTLSNCNCFSYTSVKPHPLATAIANHDCSTIGGVDECHDYFTETPLQCTSNSQNATTRNFLAHKFGSKRECVISPPPGLDDIWDTVETGDLINSYAVSMSNESAVRAAVCGTSCSGSPPNIVCADRTWDWDCDIGYYINGTTCSKCSTGSYRDDSATSWREPCTACDAGTYASTTGSIASTDCTACGGSSGSYQNKYCPRDNPITKTSLESCPTNSTGSDSGAKAVTDCYIQCASSTTAGCRVQNGYLTGKCQFVDTSGTLNITSPCTLNCDTGYHLNGAGTACDRDQYTIEYYDKYDGDSKSTTTTNCNCNTCLQCTSLCALEGGSLFSKAGYTLSQWCAGLDQDNNGTGTCWNAGGSTTSFEPSSSCAGNSVHVFAKWIPKTIDVKYNSNHSSLGTVTVSGNVSVDSCTVKTQYTLTSNRFYIGGYKFLGWANSSGGTVINTSSTTCSVNTSAPAEDMILYAIWNQCLNHSNAKTWDSGTDCVITMCQDGYYLDGTGTSTSCITCPAGKYCTGDTTQTPCPQDHYCTGGKGALSETNPPEPCGSGLYSPEGSDDSSDCVPCAPGNYMNPQCNVCPAGYYCNGGYHIEPCPAATTTICPSSRDCSNKGRPQNCFQNNICPTANSNGSFEGAADIRACALTTKSKICDKGNVCFDFSTISSLLPIHWATP